MNNDGSLEAINALASRGEVERREAAAYGQDGLTEPFCKVFTHQSSTDRL